MPELVAARWVDLQVGQYIQDQAGRLWEVEDLQQGWTRLRREVHEEFERQHLGDEATIGLRVATEHHDEPPHGPADVVTLVVLTLQEAERLVADRLGASVVHRAHVEALARWLARAHRVAIRTPSRGMGMAAHVDFVHGMHTAGMENKDVAVLHGLLHTSEPEPYGLPHHHVARA